MIQFIRHLRAAFLYARSFPYNPSTETVEWTQADSDECGRFFDHGAGKKLMQRLEMGVVNMALAAAQSGNPHSCGEANGASKQLAAIRSHFPPSQSASDYSEESDEQTALENLESFTV